MENLPVAGKLKNIVYWYVDVLSPFSEKRPKEFPYQFTTSAGRISPPKAFDP